MRPSIDVLRVDGPEPIGQPAEQVVRDALVVRPVLAVVPVRHRKPERLVGRDVVGQGFLPPFDVRPNPLLPAVEVLALLLVGVIRAEVVRAGAVLDLLMADS